MVRTRNQVAPAPRTTLGDELFDTGRWKSVVVKVSQASVLLHIVTVYCFPERRMVENRPAKMWDCFGTFSTRQGRWEKFLC